MQLLLDEIRGVTGAQNALVFDSSCRMWCAALAYFTMDPTLAAETVAGALAGLDTPLHRGGVLDGPTPRHLGFGYARAFANVYVLLLRFSGPFEVTLVRDTTEPSCPDSKRLPLHCRRRRTQGVPMARGSCKRENSRGSAAAEQADGADNRLQSVGFADLLLALAAQP
ncbi:MAG: hypothetical protein R3B72_09225 [Polyangiaceae bacterium]